MSDQDFFFDEEDSKPAAKAGKAASKPAAPSKNAPVATETTDGGGAFGGLLDREFPGSVVALLFVIGLLIGVIGGFAVGGGTGVQNAPLGDVPSTQQQPAPGQSGANPLSPDQMNQPLPQGHPTIDPGAATSSTPSSGTK